MPRKPPLHRLAELRRLPRAADVLREDGTPREDLPDADDTIRPSPDWVPPPQAEPHMVDSERVVTEGGGEVGDMGGAVIESPNPSDFGPYARITGEAIGPAAPQHSDAYQALVADCYFISMLGALGRETPHHIYHHLQRVGDMFDVTFIRNSVVDQVRITPELPSRFSTRTHPLWALLMEKAYARYRTGANTYASLGWGSPSAVARDLGYTTASKSAATSGIATVIASNDAAGIPQVCNTKATVTDSRFAASHVYIVLGSDGVNIRLFNPWGYSHPTVPEAVLAANCNALSYTTGRAVPLPTLRMDSVVGKVHALRARVTEGRNKLALAGVALPGSAALPVLGTHAARVRALQEAIGQVNARLKEVAP